MQDRHDEPSTAAPAPDTGAPGGDDRGPRSGLHPFDWRSVGVLAYDVLLAVIAWFTAYGLRFGFDGVGMLYERMMPLAAWALPAQAAVFWATGVYRGLWRYASLQDLRRIVTAAVLATALVPVVHLMLRLDSVLPRSSLLLMPLVMVALMAGSRFGYRMLREHRLARVTHRHGDPVIVIGAGDAGVTLLRELSRSARWRAVALLDDDPAKRGRVVHGVRVAGGVDDYAVVARRLGVGTAIIAMPTVPSAHRRQIVQRCIAAGAQVLTVPSFEEMMTGQVSVDWLRRIELEDLLGREPVKLDADQLRQRLTGKTVLVTGAGGSIGSELCRQIARFHPALLVLFDVSEYALYTLAEEFATLSPDTVVLQRVGDVKSAPRLAAVLDENAPDVIFHAAAYKHVPMMEEGNAWEAIRNNTLGTLRVAEAAIAHGVAEVVLISTDKAVNPTNVMGASKRLAEMVCQSLHARGPTRFEVVRFGNVLGSNGSVIPKFAEQIARGGPVTVTHPDIIRYFMSIPEAAQLVLQAAGMGRGGEIFVLDMGEPVRIVDLARDMIRLAGFTDEQIRIEFTGLRPGEKLYEELLADGENSRSTHHHKVKVARAAEVPAEWLDAFRAWLEQPRELGDEEVRRDLKRWLPEYVGPARAELRRVVG
ncbi:MAG: polysaccharide biosynthesis protein [Burkholderiales bacterium]|nr:MAG: polysaccharide biosynthesis protein [Burkholderiales bacterium]